ncbi:Hypothetical protein FKW44_009732, partial [Caligus rogercresseyi]
ITFVFNKLAGEKVKFACARLVLGWRRSSKLRAFTLSRMEANIKPNNILFI